MHGFAGFFLLAQLAAPIELPADVNVLNTRQFVLPLHVDPNRKQEVDRIRLFVSDDSGRSWKHRKDYKPSDDRIDFTALHDGSYWFALQIRLKNGTHEPMEVTRADVKVYVNTERKSLKVQDRGGDLRREVEDLRKKVEQLEKRINELEGERTRK